MAETRFHSALKAKILEVLERRRTDIASGACTTYDHYKRETGYVDGLLDALKLAEDTEREFD